MSEQETPYSLVKRMEKNLTSGSPVRLGKYTEHDHYEKISTISAYLDSQHISGKFDSLGREKPFFNIVLMAVYTWYKATDIDRKHITFRPANSSKRLKSLIATILLREWMIKTNFGAWLNKWGFGLSAYGSIPAKFIEQGGELKASITQWENLICDPIDFEGNPKAEKIWFTPAQLERQKYDTDKIEEAIEKFKEIRKTLDNQPADMRNDFIGLYELHGDLSLNYLTGKETDVKKYRQQMHVLFMENNPQEGQEEVEMTLFSGKESKDPYYLSHLIERDGRALSVGAVELLFDPQWMVNHTSKQVKDQMDLASKMIMQTADPQFLGRNVLTEVDTGSVLIHEENKPLTQLNNQGHDIPNLINLLNQWKQGAREISFAHESQTGEQPPSGTPFRLQALLQQVGGQLFEMMRENKALHLKEIMRKYVLPSFKKFLNNSEEVAALLEGEELENFDNLAMPINLEKQLFAQIMQGRIPTRTELFEIVAEQNKALGEVRTLRPSAKKDATWKEYFEDLDLEKTLDIVITGEGYDRQAALQNAYFLLRDIIANPQALQDPNARKLFNKVVDEAGVSPLLFVQTPAPQQGTTGGELPPKAGVRVPGEVGAGVGVGVGI